MPLGVLAMPAPETTREFLDLVQRSGVVDDVRLKTYLAKLSPASVFPSKPSTLASQLVRDGMLTIFQAEQVLAGRWRRFTIGPYKALEYLGSGKQANVFLCQNTVLQRRVAVKVLPSSSNNDPVSVKRFMRECQILAGLDHPNIVRPYDLGQDDALHYMALEYVDGSSLEEIVQKRGQMDVTRVAHYVRQAALALQHVHERGVVHRDVKPAEILVDRRGGVKLIDMGLARIVPDGISAPTGRYDGAMLGTPDYMAPEQAVDPRVDIRADIYGLGATFYFCLTQRTPLEGGTAAETLPGQQTRQPEPIRQLRPEVPDGLAALIERMMAKDPAWRPQTSQEVAAALAPYTAEPIGPPPEDEMPRLSPAASGGQSPEMGNVTGS
jgi:serine/threonine protein kinase